MTGLQRTALTRRTELRRGEPLRRRKAIAKVAVARRTVEKQRRQRDTGLTKATKAVLWARANGRCELCGRYLQPGDPFSRHHRRPRGQGGSTVDWVNDVTNLLLLCGSATTPGGCHQLVESQRALAGANGWLVSLHGTTTPAEIPVLLFDHFDPVYLTEAGGYAYTLEESS